MRTSRRTLAAAALLASVATPASANPGSVAIQGDRIWSADIQTGLITEVRRAGTTGTPVRTFGGIGITPGLFDGLIDIEAQGDSLWVQDRTRLQELGFDGLPRRSMPLPGCMAPFNPFVEGGLAVSATEVVATSACGGGAIVAALDRLEARSQPVGTAVAGGAAFAAPGQFVLADPAAGTLVRGRVDAEPEGVDAIGGRPVDVAFGADGRVWVDETTGELRAEGPRVLAPGGLETGELRDPLDVDADDDTPASTRRLAVADHGNNRIQVFEPTGAFAWQWQPEERIAPTRDESRRGISVQINAGAAYTRARKVQVRIPRLPAGTRTVVLSPNRTFRRATRLRARPSGRYPFTLPAGVRGTQAVYVRFLGSARPKRVYRDNIGFDDQPPEVTSAQVSGVTLRIVAADRGAAGLRVMQIAATPQSPVTTRPISFETTLPSGVGPTPVVRVIDRAGNVSPWRRV